MGSAYDTLRLKRLAALCAARRDAAVQDQAVAMRDVENAGHARSSAERDVERAHGDWERILASIGLGCELARASGDALVVRAQALAVAVDGEAEARRILALREADRRDADARMRQVEEIGKLCRRTDARRRERSLLAMVEDGNAQRWRRR